MSHRERGEPLRRETVTHVSGIKRHLSHRNRHAVIGAPGEIRTPDPLVRSQVLYPTELRARREDERVCGSERGFGPNREINDLLTRLRFGVRSNPFKPPDRTLDLALHRPREGAHPTTILPSARLACVIRPAQAPRRDLAAGLTMALYAITSLWHHRYRVALMD